MPQTTTSTGITFAVDDVTPATEPLSEWRAHEAVRAMLDSEIESCSDYHGSVVKDVGYQPLLAAVYMAFSQHRPLALSPDSVWITIAQGVAHHMAIHGERLRSRFVSHQGKITLEVKVRGWVEGSPENPWPEAFAKWAGQIRDHVGHATHDALVCDFSTSGPLEQSVSLIVMMDVFERYFAYRLVSVCGIPTVTLEGTPADWERLLAKVRALRVFDIDWWLDHLEPICEQFVQASRGDVDLAHWRDICKLRRAYGGDIINGWVAKLFPYLRAFWKGPCNRRNPTFDKDGEGFQTFVAPPGLSRVSFTWVNGQTGKERAMEAIGGLVGVAQDAATLALRPKLGWAVREADVITSVLYALRSSKYHVLRPGLTVEDQPYTGLWPKDMATFYAASDGAELFRTDVDGPHLRLLPAREIADDGNRRWPSANWCRIATLSDGSWLAMNRNPEPGPFLCEAIKRRMQPGQRPCAICHCGHWTISRPNKSPVVALSFGELLDELVKSHGMRYWLLPDFVPYGDAEQFTRRVSNAAPYARAEHVMRSAIRTTMFALALLASPAAHSADWPQFRGPNRDGISTERNFPLTWSPGKNVRWSAKLPAGGNSSPIVIGGRVFVTCAEDPKGTKRSLYCFNADDGKQLWVRSVSYQKTDPTHQRNPYCAATPAADAKRVVAWFGSAGVVCYDHDGKELWTRDLGEFRHIWGHAASPVLHGDVVLMNCAPGARTFVTALDAKTGKTIWQTDEPGGAEDRNDKGEWLGSWDTPVIAKVDGHEQVLVAQPRHVNAYDLQTGKILWTCGGTGLLAYSDVMVDDGIAVAASGYTGPAIGFRLGGTGDVTDANRLWRVERNPQRVGTGVVRGPHLFMVSEPGFSCIEMATGREIWKHHPKGDTFWGSIVEAGGRLYVTSQKGTTYVFAADPTDYHELAVNELGEASNSTPALADGRIYLRTYGHVYCIEER